MTILLVSILVEGKGCVKPGRAEFQKSAIYLPNTDVSLLEVFVFVATFLLTPFDTSDYGWLI